MKALNTRLPVVASPNVVPPSVLRWTSVWGMVGVGIYFAGYALPLQWNMPMLGFALCSILAIAISSRSRIVVWSPLLLAVMAFLGATVVSTVWSVDLDRSLRFSTPFLPAGLLFFVAVSHWEGTRDIRRLYWVLSAVGLGLAATVLWGVWTASYGLSLKALVPQLGIPILVVPNDLTVLAVIAPLSLALFYHKPRSAISISAVLSILLSIGAVCAFQSRTAALTMIITVTCAFILMQPKQRLIYGVMYGLGLFLFVLLIDSLLGFPLTAKVIRKATILGRVSYWSTAWNMFLEAPLLGNGPHTFGRFHKTPWAHNLYLEVLAEQGLLGLLALGGLLTCGLVGGWTLRRAPTKDGRLLGAGALAGLVGFCAAGVVELTLLREWVVTMLFMLLGVISHLVLTQPPRGRVDKWIASKDRVAEGWARPACHAPVARWRASRPSPILKRRESTME
jgi:O-antigen ligase